MSNAIVKRLEKILYGSGPEEKQATEHKQPTERKGVITCTRLRRLQQMQSELITQGSLTDNWVIENPVADLSEPATNDINRTHTKAPASLRDLIAARIAQTENADSAVKAESARSAKNDRNRTLMNLDSLAASIYCWSPYAAWSKEERKSQFMRSNVRGRTYPVNDALANNHTQKNKETFINFSQPALIMVASNPETPTSTLKWLAAHHSAEVRKAVAKNANSDDTTMILLAEDLDYHVKNAVLDNTRISKELAAKLASDKNLAVSTKARNIYYQLDVKSKEPCPPSQATTVRTEEIVQNEREFLKAIADSADTSKRLIVKSPQLTADWHIRMLVAGSPNATTEILWQLASHPISQVKRKLVDKYNCLLETVVNLKGHKTHDSYSGLVASSTQTIN